jgi:hypothetical protein
VRMVSPGSMLKHLPVFLTVTLYAIKAEILQFKQELQGTEGSGYKPVESQGLLLVSIVKQVLRVIALNAGTLHC